MTARGARRVLRVPEEVVVVDGLHLRRTGVDDAPALARAVAESIDHLSPWMQWATPEAATQGGQRARLAAAAGPWKGSDDWEYAMFLPEDAAQRVVVGGCGLHHRQGPGTLEIGYWVHAAHTGRGLATRAATALTDLGFSLVGVECMEIRCDAANAPSAAVPHRLGYVLAEERPCPPAAPAEVGLEQVWRSHRRSWSARVRARAPAAP